MPKKAGSAFLFFNTEFVLAERKKNPACTTTEAFKLAGQKWGQMTENDKVPYVKLSDGDKARYERQLTEREKKGYFTLDNKTKSTDPANAKLFKKKKSSSETEEEAKELKPKRAISAYIYFASDFSEKTRKAKPELKITEISVLAGKKWSEMSDAEKKPFVEMNEQDKARQEKQQQSLEKKGYFIMEDGSKSTDEKNLPTHKRRLSKASKSLPSDQEETKAVKKPMKKTAAQK